MEAEFDPMQTPGKPTFIRWLRAFVEPHLELPEGRATASILLDRLRTWERTDVLGGPTCSAMILAMGRHRQALQLEEYPYDMTETAWFYVTF